MSNELRKINSRTELIADARDLGVRPDWHEPDEQGVTAEVHGSSFDNAGFWGQEAEGRAIADGYGADFMEMWVTLSKDGKPVAEVNLATLFAWATGYEAGDNGIDEGVRARAFGAAQKLEEASKDLAARARELRNLSNAREY